ncbi:VapE domain-containing protein [Ruminococcus sp.]|uniref:VapE domain-containing protein n=1 Tax=Ruminococcus sp. TaxID=41978 RepID=UPI001B7A6432|nr:VapE domain-containing protein [Ruminococcus sp.]MBP5432161.1 hypothetical protein [Ruminococcus sp.]
MNNLEWRFTYDEEDFTTSEPYSEIIIIDNEFLRAQRLEELAKEAKKFGINNFKYLYRAYEKTCHKVHSKQNTDFDLECGEDGKKLSSTENFVRILEHDKQFTGLKFNLLTYSPEQEREGVMCRWTDKDDAAARHYMEYTYKIHNAAKCDDALRVVFGRNEYHPIRDLVDSLEWDKQDRISNFLSYAAKCEDTEYTREVSRLIFAGGIHRLYQSGCKFDDMPVLIGTKQGEGKSTLVRWLAMKDEYFTEVNEFDGQKGIEALEGAWICEVSELLAMTKVKEQEAVKSFLTRLNDRYRMPYDKRITDHPRQCIFIGTTNKEQFLTDKTGNRRFYPVRVRQSGYELFEHEKDIKEYIKQCWAEAKAKYDTEFMQPYAKHELIEIIRQKQSEAVEDDFRVGMIEDYLDGRDEVCILELWQQALKNGETKPSKKDSIDIALILSGSFPDWEKQPAVKRFPNYGIQKWWKCTKFTEYEDILL